MRLKTQIFLAVFLAGFVTTSLIGIMFLLGFENSTFKLLREYNSTTSQFTVQMVYQNLDNDGVIDSQELESLSNRLNNVSLGPDGYAYIIDGSGILIIHPTSVGKDISDKLHIQEMIKNKTGHIRYAQTTPPNIGREKEVHYRYIEELDWIVAAGPYLDDVKTEVSKAKMHLLLSLIVALVINLLIAFWLSHTIYSPIKHGSEQIHMLVHRINSKKLKKEISHQIETITGDKALDKTLDSIKKLTPKKHI